jgi:hydroxymethylbilane synthase
MPRDKIIIGTRGSLLAVSQTQWVASQIAAVCPGVRVETQRIATTGDKRPADAIPQIGQKGIFTFELEQALLAGRIDLAIHSAKDLPTETPPELDLLLVPPREDPRDAIVSREDKTLNALPEGAVVGTSSLRRQAQLTILRPDLRFIPLRGNVDTRINKVRRGDCDAAMLALAGLRRCSLAVNVAQILDADVMVPAPGQGILAVQGRRDDDELRAMLSPLDDAGARTALAGERRLIERLEGGCRTPIGAWVRRARDRLRGDAIVAMPDGSKFVRASAETPDSDWQSLADDLVEQLRRQGAEDIIAASRA